MKTILNRSLINNRSLKSNHINTRIIQQNKTRVGIALETKKNELLTDEPTGSFEEQAEQSKEEILETEFKFKVRKNQSIQGQKSFGNCL